MSSNIKSKELLKREMKDFTSSRLILGIEGSDVSYAFINALRRTMIDDIPVYAFDPSTINIEFNDSVILTDALKLRLSNLPIFDIKNDIVFLSRKYWSHVDFTDPERPKHSDEKNIELYINVHNDTLENQHYTTENVKMFIDGEQVKKAYKKTNPILLITLKPNQAFKAKLKAVLAVGELSNIYSGVSNCYYEALNDSGNKFKLTIESQGQMDEYVLLNKACDILVKKLTDTLQNLENLLQKTDDDDLIEIKLINEDFTLGNLIVDNLQEHKDVTYAGAPKHDKLIKEIIIQYVTKSKNKIEPVKEVINKQIKLINSFKNQLK